MLVSPTFISSPLPTGYLLTTPKHSTFSSPDWTHSAIVASLLKLLFFFKHFNCFLLCVCLMCDGACMCCGIHVRENFVELVFPLHLYVGTRIGHKLSGLSGNSNLAQNFISWLKMTLPVPTKQKSRTSFKSLFPSFSLSSHQVIFILPVSPFTWPLECNTPWPGISGSVPCPRLSSSFPWRSLCCLFLPVTPLTGPLFQAQLRFEHLVSSTVLPSDLCLFMPRQHSSDQHKWPCWAPQSDLGPLTLLPQSSEGWCHRHVPLQQV